MLLSIHDQNNLLREFPNIELSYEKKLHKKVQSDICLTLPKGQKYFAWFKTFKKDNLCFLLQINRRFNSISNISVNICCFDKILCADKGTILFGTIFYINKQPFFNIENIYYSRGYSLIDVNQYNKLTEIGFIMKNYIKQVAYLPNSTIFGTPNIAENSYILKKCVNDLSYDLYSIQHRLLYNNKPFLNEIVTVQKEIYKIFQLQATIINDIYDLYYLNETYLEKYKTACIPNYKTSVMMNSLFRNIKENANLDALEESDDEDEFENISLDKYVNLDKKIIMKCLYIRKFDSWIPIEISTESISPRREILYYKKK